MKHIPCCRLDQEFICGIVRNRSGIDSGELEISVRSDRIIRDKNRILNELKFLIKHIEENYEQKA